MKIKISADSTCDLSPELIERYHIGITPLYIIRGEETLRDGIDVHPQELYDYANATGKLCKTAAATRTPVSRPRSLRTSTPWIRATSRPESATWCSTRPRWLSRAWTRPTLHRRWRKSARSLMSAS